LGQTRRPALIAGYRISNQVTDPAWGFKGFASVLRTPGLKPKQIRLRQGLRRDVFERAFGTYKNEAGPEGPAEN
jgi:hypothetical protein